MAPPRFRGLVFLAAIAWLAGLSIFFYVYVPLVPRFLVWLAPFLVLTFVLTLWKTERGLLFFIFAFPLINNLPYFFGIGDTIPHAPTALVLFLVFFLAWLVRQAFFSEPHPLPSGLAKSLRLLGILLILSALITFLRFSDFFPLGMDAIRELVVNVNGVRAGGAIMSLIFNFLNYATGLLFFLLLYRTVRSNNFRSQLWTVLAVSTGLSLLFGFGQRFFDISLGNTRYWINLGQINATFKDPNAFGAYLAAFLPLTLGMAIHSHKTSRRLFLALFIAGMLIFPAIGSRSAWLALIAALIVFFGICIPRDKKYWRKIALVTTAIVLFMTILIVVQGIIFRSTSLAQRFRTDIKRVARKEEGRPIASQKPGLWLIALEMIKDYPLAGVGLGSYIIDLPNYSKHMKRTSNLGYTDSAENYVLQIGAELGLIGLLFFGVLYFRLARPVVRRIRSFPLEKDDRWLVAGVFSGLIAFLVNYCFHSYIGSFEITYFFWFLVAILFNWARERCPDAEDEEPSGRFPLWIAAGLVVAFGAFHLDNARHGLSLATGRTKYGWAQNFGFYDYESDSRNFLFRWTKKQAGLTIKALSPRLVLPIMASHPDIDKDPVKVNVYLADQAFRKKSLIREIVLDTSGWKEFEFALSPLPFEEFSLIFETSRTWQPAQAHRAPDPRHLAIGLGDYWFRYDSKLPWEKSADIETHSPDQWRGTQKNALFRNGRSTMQFKATDSRVAFGLWVRGEKAFGIGPLIVIKLDDTDLAKTTVSEDGWTRLILEAPSIHPGEHTLSVTYINDISRKAIDQDRNVELGKLEIIRPKSLPPGLRHGRPEKEDPGKRRDQ
jgi:O-antigen ligase